jgi:hypothetical protein
MHSKIAHHLEKLGGWALSSTFGFISVFNLGSSLRVVLVTLGSCLLKFFFYPTVHQRPLPQPALVSMSSHTFPSRSAKPNPKHSLPSSHSSGAFSERLVTTSLNSTFTWLLGPPDIEVMPGGLRRKEMSQQAGNSIEHLGLKKQNKGAGLRSGAESPSPMVSPDGMDWQKMGACFHFVSSNKPSWFCT